MNNIRERLIELLTSSPTLDVVFGDTSKEWESSAKHLIANGVTVQKYGQWNTRYSSKTKVWCSVCDHRRDIYTQIGWNYCPNCGSKMEV